MSEGGARGEAPGGRAPSPRLQSWAETAARALVELTQSSPARRAEVSDSRAA